MKLIVLLGLVGLSAAIKPWTNLFIKWDLVPRGGGFDDAMKWLGSDTGAYVDNFCPSAVGGIHDKPFLYFSFADPNSTFVSPFVMAKTVNDKTITVMYDNNNNLAGIQNWIPATSGFAPDPTGQEAAYYVKVFDKSTHTYFYVQTVYFQDPATICSGAPYRNGAMGSALYFQNGPNPLTDYFKAPLTQNEIEADPAYKGTGKCFRTMGQHYWYNVHKDMQCKDMHPYCLLYNGGELNAFCFASNAHYTDTELDYPAPSYKVIGQFMADVPSCMNANNAKWSTFATVHVYLTKHPLFNFC